MVAVESASQQLGSCCPAGSYQEGASQHLSLLQTARITVICLSCVLLWLISMLVHMAVLDKLHLHGQAGSWLTCGLHVLHGVGQAVMHTHCARISHTRKLSTACISTHHHPQALHSPARALAAAAAAVAAAAAAAAAAAIRILEDMGVLKELMDNNEAHFADAGVELTCNGTADAGLQPIHRCSAVGGACKLQTMFSGQQLVV
jgi:hypothetical protein